MKRLRILFAGSLPPYRGGSATVHNVVLRLLAAQGHSIRAVSTITPGDRAVGDWFAAANPSLRIRRFEVPFYLSATTTTHPRELETQRAAFATLIGAECAAQPPHVLLLGDAITTFASPARRPPGIPIAMLAHGTALHRLHHRLGSDQEVADLWDCYHGADYLIAVAAHQSPCLNDLGLLRYSLIPNIIDTREFAPREKSTALLLELGIAPDDVVIAHFSNLKPVKRPFDLVAAAAIALPRNPRLLFVVGGDGDLRDAVEAKCSQLGIASRFRFPGWIRGDRMAEYYSICDAVVMPSESEARSMVYLETQASGRLLIASAIAASREAIEDGVTGMLFPTGSQEALAERILTAAADPALRAALGRQARLAAEKCNLAAYAASFERALLELVKTDPRGPANPMPPNQADAIENER